MALDILGPANAPNSVTARPADDRSFGVTDTWWKDCSSSAANDGTKWKSAPINGIVALLRSLVRGNGNTALAAPIVTEDNTDDAMALKAIQHMIQRGQPGWAVDAGAANAIVVSLTPAAAEYKAGMVVRVKVGFRNTGPSTINVNALGAKAVILPNGSALIGAELQPSSISEFHYDGTAFQLVGSDPLPIINGRKTTLVYAPGTYSWTCPANITKVEVEGRGGGGAGGSATGAGYAAGGASGASYFFGQFTVVPGTTYNITVGSGAAFSAVGNSGSNGGSTSFGPFATAPGGLGSAAANSGLTAAAAAPANASGGQINQPGGPGGPPQNVGGLGQGGTGGGSYGQGGGNIPAILNGGGIGGVMPGLGGNGGGGSSAAPNAIGGPGGPGELILRY